MIRKFFIVGKKLYLQGKNMDGYSDLGHVIELSIPIETYWELEDLLKEIDYMRSAGASQAEIFERYREVFGVCAPYAIFEKERKWLYDRSTGKK